MKVQVNTFEFNYRDSLTVKVEEQELSFCDGEPEDNGLRRNFNDCYKIVDFMKLAHAAGKAGEEFEIEETEKDPFE